LLESTIVAAPEYVLQKNEKALAFEESFSKLYGHTPSLYAVFAYNAMQILLEGLVEGIVIGKGNAETVSFKVTNKKYNGVMGAVSVDNEGGLTVPMGLGVIRKGKIMPRSDNWCLLKKHGLFIIRPSMRQYGRRSERMRGESKQKANLHYITTAYSA
jgi:hypothetical protein